MHAVYLKMITCCILFLFFLVCFNKTLLFIWPRFKIQVELNALHLLTDPVYKQCRAQHSWRLLRNAEIFGFVRIFM